MSAELQDLLNSETLDLDAIGASFDAMSHEDRVVQIRTLGKSIQRKLFHAAEGRGGLNLEYMVPTGHGPLKEVIHWGKNSLPLFTVFQKRFCRLPDSDTVLGGYNEHTLGWATGPGYFTTVAVENDGEVDIDYTQLPEQKAENWPEIIPQKDKLGRLVYCNMIDRLRRISGHVTIGRAIKHGKETENYFLLCRQDPA